MEVKMERLSVGLARVRGDGGRTVYVEYRAGAEGCPWVVHVDGCGREAPRQYPCRTMAMVRYRLECELGVRRA